MTSVTDGFLTVENEQNSPAKILESLFWEGHGLFGLILVAPLILQL